MRTTGPIVVGVDGSEAAVQALRWAAEQAQLTGARLVALTAYTIPATIFVTPTYTEADYARDAQTALDVTVEKAFGPDSPVPVEKYLVQQRPGRALTEAAVDARLLVIGGRGQGEFPGLHLGSVASYCVHHAPCPVLVVHTDHEASADR